MNKLFVPFLPPWVETGLQPAFYDKESGTVLQQTARMYDKVNQLIRNFNDLSKETKETVEEYILKFTELKDFVDDYFDNLDVQEEINNKLDAMAEDGSLQVILDSYVRPQLQALSDKIDTDVATEKSARITADTTLQNQINGLASGSPLVASSTAGMTDTTRVYVNTTDGKWYYYDGDSWEIGGTYQATSDPEVENIRTAYNGTIFDTAGNAVRGQVSDINTTLSKAFDYNRTYTEYGSSSAEITAQNAYINPSNGNIVSNASYLMYSMQATARCYVYPTSSQTWCQFAVYNSSTFNSSSLVKLTAYGGTNPLPTKNTPLEVQAGNYIVMTANTVTATMKINVSTSYGIELKDIPLNINYNALAGIEMMENKYIDNVGIYKDEATDVNKPLASKYFNLFYGDKIHYHLKTSTSASSFWMRFAMYDKDFNFLDEETVTTAAKTGDGYKYTDWEFTIDQPECVYCAISFRTYNFSDPQLEYYVNVIANPESFSKRIELANKIGIYNRSYPFDNLYPLSIAHRGDEAVAPENTLPAFRLAKSKGWDFVETDVAVTRDGVPVLLHDTTINRVARNTDGTEILDEIAIEDIDYDDLLQYSFGYYKDPMYADIKICTLEELLQLAKKISLYIRLDIKPSVVNGNYFETVYKLLDKYGMKDRVQFVAPSAGILLPFLEYYPKFFMVMDNEMSLSENAIVPVERLMTPYNQVAFDPSKTYLTDSTMKNCISKGIKIGTWLLSTEEEMLSLDQRVDEVTTNYFPYRKVLYDNNIGDPDTGLLDS